MKKDELGDRMKENYEDRTRIMLPRRTHTLIRLDGKAFHTYTKKFKRPYDLSLMKVMDDTAIALCEQVQGVSMAFVQSDEITLLLTDFATIHTSAWFDGNLQKMASISASIATAAFNQEMLAKEAEHFENSWHENTGMPSNVVRSKTMAYFDARVWTISDRDEVANCFIWRQQDATRNSIQMAAQSMYSHKELHGKDTSELQEMMFQKGVNWNDYPVGFKRGRIILKEKIEKVKIPAKALKHTDSLPDSFFGKEEAYYKDLPEIERKSWASFEPPIFTQDREFLMTRIPLPEKEGQ